MAKTRAPAGRPPPSERPKNHLLAALPAKDFQRLLPHLTTVPIRLKQVLHQVGQPLRVVYFLNGGAASIVTLLSDDTMVEAATVGNEGMLGIEAFLSAGAIATGHTLMQVADRDAERMSVEDFRREVAGGGALHALIGRYTQVILAQLMQSTACNARHAGAVCTTERGRAEATELMRRHTAVLAHRPVWLFSVGSFGDRHPIVGGLIKKEPKEISEFEHTLHPVTIASLRESLISITGPRGGGYCSKPSAGTPGTTASGLTSMRGPRGSRRRFERRTNRPIIVFARSHVPSADENTTGDSKLTNFASGEGVFATPEG